MVKIIDGNAIAKRIRERIRREVKKLHVKPGLAVILVGNNSASKVYVSRKSVVCEDLGFYLEKYEFDEHVAENKLIELIETLNNKETVHGILVQLPLPKHLNTRRVIERISPRKDIDGFLPNSPFIPCTAKGIITLLKEVTTIEGKSAVVIGRSSIVGKPTALLLLDENATVTICHSKTKNLEQYTQRADILVSAAGKPHLITKEMVKADAVVIDVGVTNTAGKISGDVDFENVKDKVAAITPVPGGVGPMTIAMLMENVFLAAKKTQTIRYPLSE